MILNLNKQRVINNKYFNELNNLRSTKIFIDSDEQYYYLLKDFILYKINLNTAKYLINMMIAV